MDLIPQLHAAGVSALKIEGRQRSPAYIAQVVSIWRAALDSFATAPQRYHQKQEWLSALAKVAEGAQTTLGAYSRPWQ